MNTELHKELQQDFVVRDVVDDYLFGQAAGGAEAELFVEGESGGGVVARTWAISFW